MLTARMFSSFLKFNSYPGGGKDRYFNGLDVFAGRKPWSCLDFDPKWGEIRMNIVEILVFFTFEVVHDQVSQWGCQDLPGCLENVLRQGHLNDFMGWPDTVKRQHIEKRGVDHLTYRCRADRAHP